MRTVIVYKSKMGSTKKYAEDIASEVQGEAVSINKVRWNRIGDYDTVVFGGWVMGNTIQGIDKFLSHYDKIKNKNVILFSVGMSVTSNEGRDIIIEQNLLDEYHVRYYQLRGSFNYLKLNLFYRLLISNSLRMITMDKDATPDQKSLSSIKSQPIEYYDHAKIDRIIGVIRSFKEVVEVKAVDKK